MSGAKAACVCVQNNVIFSMKIVLRRKGEYSNNGTIAFLGNFFFNAIYI